MALARIIVLLLFLVSLFGCISALQHPEISQTSGEKAHEAQQEKTAIPTFTYRPGG